MYYLDSSAVVKLVFEEKESKTLREFLKKNMDFKLNEIYSLIHKLQPQALLYP